MLQKNKWILRYQHQKLNLKINIQFINIFLNFRFIRILRVRIRSDPTVTIQTYRAKKYRTPSRRETRSKWNRPMSDRKCSDSILSNLLMIRTSTPRVRAGTKTLDYFFHKRSFNGQYMVSLANSQLLLHVQHMVQLSVSQPFSFHATLTRLCRYFSVPLDGHIGIKIKEL